jgi:peptide deformylase
VASFTIRQYGDPVLRQRARDVDEIDVRLHQLVTDMVDTMYEAPGVGLAAPQIGVQKRLFVYDSGDGRGPRTVINPVIAESSGEWTCEEGCLSVPGLAWEIVRPLDVHLTGWDLDGNEVSIEATEFEARVLQHELDHLDGILLVEHLDDDQRREAKRILRSRAFASGPDPDGLRMLGEVDGRGGRRNGDGPPEL